MIASNVVYHSYVAVRIRDHMHDELMHVCDSSPAKSIRDNELVASFLYSSSPYPQTNYISYTTNETISCNQHQEFSILTEDHHTPCFPQ